MIENNFVNGILDNDLYKFTMQNAVCFNYPNEVVSYNFINRDNREFPDGFADELVRVLDTFRGFKLTKGGKNFLKMKCDYLNPVYLDFLEGYRFNPNEVHVSQKDSELTCFVQGPWYRTILWEPPLMATISQLYFDFTSTSKDKYSREKRKQNNKEKAFALKDIGAKYNEFGSRRRESLDNHKEVVRDLKEYMEDALVGTSNVQLALENCLTPMGTHAHEWFMFHAAKYGFRMANQLALKVWIKTYKGKLGIALPDTFTTDVFLRDFDDLYARQFDGLRHDSSTPVDFMYKAVNHYNGLNIDPMTKTIVFSDSINNIPLVDSIHAA